MLRTLLALSAVLLSQFASANDVSTSVVSEMFAGPLRTRRSLLMEEPFDGENGQSAVQRVKRQAEQAKSADPNTELRGAVPDRLPIPGCFFEENGYMCCSKDLHSFLNFTYGEYVRTSQQNHCNTQSLINFLHAACEKRYKVPFEAVVGLEDFAQIIHFRGDLACKTILGGDRYLIAYASPSDEPLPVYHPQPPTTTTEAPTAAPPSPQPSDYTPAPAYGYGGRGGYGKRSVQLSRIPAAAVGGWSHPDPAHIDNVHRALV